MTSFVVCWRFFLGCEQFLRMCSFQSSTLWFFPEMVFCLTSKHPRMPYRQWIMLHCVHMMHNGKDLSTDWKTQILGHAIHFHASPFYPSSSAPGSSASGETPPRLLFPYNLVCRSCWDWTSGRCSMPALWPNGQGQEPGFVIGSKRMLSLLPRGSCPPWSACPWVALSSPHRGAVFSSGFSGPSLFPWAPISSFLGLFGLLSPRRRD